MGASDIGFRRSSDHGHYVSESPGVGKTHLAVSLAEAVIQSGQAAYFMTAHDLVTDLGRAYREGRLDCRLRIYLAPKVLIIDEMGYLPLDDLGATIFFSSSALATKEEALFSLPTRAMANGARSSATRSSRRRFSTDCCIIRPQ
jgi:chromosomal replication initiation ATPase DnaA